MMEWDINYTDNSHIIGRPIRVWQESHCSLIAKRDEVVHGNLLKELRAALREVEIHIEYK